MPNQKNVQGRSRSKGLSLSLLLTIAIIIGVVFRFTTIDYKVYWHDEVYTTMRSAGFTRGEIDQELFQNQLFSVSDLQKFQRIKPGGSWIDTIDSLALEDPQHPPLYFLLARFWLQIFGNSLTASRTLPIIISLFSLPLIYLLARELFGLHLVSLMATALFALSPFDILFAQTARQYSFLTLATLLSSWFLVKVIRQSRWQLWLFYSLSITLGFYIHPLMILTVIGHGFLVIGNCLFGKNQINFRNLVSNFQPILSFGLAILGTIALYFPWLFVLINNLQRANATTNWTQSNVNWLYLVKLWILSFTSLFFDLDFGFDNLFTYVWRLPFLGLTIWGIYIICRSTKPLTWLFILTTIFIPFLALALPDLIIGGKRSAVSRYLIACYPGIQLAVAFGLIYALNFFKNKISQKFWQGLIVFVLTSSLISLIVSATSNTWWCKDLSYFNAAIAAKINATPKVLVISDIGDDYTNTGDLISLSYILKPDVKFWLVSQSPKFDQNLMEKYQVFVFRPSGKIRSHLSLKIPIPDQFAGQLWQVERINFDF